MKFEITAPIAELESKFPMVKMTSEVEEGDYLVDRGFIIGGRQTLVFHQIIKKTNITLILDKNIKLFWREGESKLSAYDIIKSENPRVCNPSKGMFFSQYVKKATMEANMASLVEV